MKLRSLLRLAFAAGTIELSSHASAAPDDPPRMPPEGVHWIVRPLPIATTDEVRTAGLYDLLFRQTFVPASAVVLDKAIEVPAVVGTPTVVLPKGYTLFEVGFTWPGYGRLSAFCGPEITQKQSSFLGLKDGRTCLGDADSDGVFDTSLYNGVEDDSLVFGEMAMRTGKPRITVPYVRTRTDQTPLFTLGPVVIRYGLTDFQLAFAAPNRGTGYVLNGRGLRVTHRVQPGDTQDAEFIHFTRADLPVKLHFMGAQIEILSIEGSTVTYRVASGFSGNEPMGIAWGGILPRK